MKKLNLKQCHIILIILGIIFIMLPVFNGNVWFDESYSVAMARQNLGDIWNIGGHDVHPVLYYWFLRVVYLITGGPIIAYKIFSAIPIAIMIILGFTHIRKDFGEKAGIIFSFLCATLPEMAYYAQEVRMYSWAILSVTVLAIYAWRLLKKDSVKDWIIFGISSLISIYLHYYGLMAAGLINVALLVYLIIKKRKRGLIYIISFGIIQAIAYIPWMMALLSQMGHVSNGFWIGFTWPKTLMELLGCQLAGYIRTTEVPELIAPTIFAVELYAYTFYKAYKLYKEKQDLKPFYFSAGMYLAVILAAIIITKIMKQSILYYRYLFVITGLYIFAITYILSKEKNKIAIFTILAVIAGLGLYNNIGLIKDNYDSSNNKPLQYMAENIKKEDIVVYTDCGVGSVAAVHNIEPQVYFLNEDNWGVQEAYKCFGPNYETVINREFLENAPDRIWVIDNKDGSASKDLFGDETKYKKVSEEIFETKYHNYAWKITLIEKTK